MALYVSCGWECGLVTLDKEIEWKSTCNLWLVLGYRRQIDYRVKVDM